MYVRGSCINPKFTRSWETGRDQILCQSLSLLLLSPVFIISLSCLYVIIHWYLSETMEQVPYRETLYRTQSRITFEEMLLRMFHIFCHMQNSPRNQKPPNILVSRNIRSLNVALFTWHFLQQQHQQNNNKNPLSKDAKYLEISGFDPKIHRPINTTHISSASMQWTKT